MFFSFIFAKEGYKKRYQQTARSDNDGFPGRDKHNNGSKDHHTENEDN